jgi:hypothetical protein
MGTVASVRIRHRRHHRLAQAEEFFELALQRDAFGHAGLYAELDLVALAQVRQQPHHGDPAYAQALRDLVLRHLLDEIHPGHAQAHALVALAGPRARERRIQFGGRRRLRGGFAFGWGFRRFGQGGS